MNTLDKQEQPNDILSNLYALRAGLSLIYKEKTQLDAYEENIKNQINENNEKCEDNAQSIQHEMTCLEEKISELEDKRDNRPYFYNRVSPGIILLRFIGSTLLTLLQIVLIAMPIILIGGWVLATIGSYMIADGITSDPNALTNLCLQLGQFADYLVDYAIGDWTFLVMFASLAIAVISVIVLIYMTPSWFHNLCRTFELTFNYSRFKEQGIKYDSETDYFNESIKNAQDKWIHLSQNRESILRDLNSPFMDKNLDLQADFEQEKATKYSIISAINTSLKNTFSNFLDSRDWKHVDYLIFLFESNRVYSMHEALQRLDNYAFYKDIKNTVMESHNYLSNLINTSFNNLNVNIQNGLNRINSTLIKSAELTAINSQLICSKLNSLQVGIEDFISTQSLHNALIEQSNVDSQKLVENLEQLNDTIKDESYKIRSGYQY